MVRSSRISSRVRVSGRNPYFFKVFFPQLSSEHLKIPSKFEKHIEGGRSPNTTISLKGPSGSIWCVNLVKNSDGLFFENGWKEFVADHSLVFGDFLVFRYEGNLRFTVLLFDNTACEKEEAFSVRPSQADIAALAMSRGGEESVEEESSRALLVSSDQVSLKRKRRIVDCLALEGPLQKRRSPLMKVAEEKSQTPFNRATVRKSRNSSKIVKEKSQTPFHSATVRKSRNRSKIVKEKPQTPVHRATVRKSRNRSKIVKEKPQTPFHRATVRKSRNSSKIVKEKPQTPFHRATVRKSRNSSKIVKAIIAQKQVGKSCSPSRLSKVCRGTLREKSPMALAKASARSRTSKPRSSSDKPNEFGKTNSSIQPCKMPPKRLPFNEYCQMPRLGEVVVMKQRQGGLKSQRRPVTEEELDKAFEMAVSFTSKNPFFTLEMQDSHVYFGFFVNIPQTFAMEHLPEDSRNVTLWDPNGKDWKVTCISYGSHGGLSAGWSKFSLGNNLEKGDICVFELIEKYDLKVYIFRVVEELTPLIRNPEG